MSRPIVYGQPSHLHVRSLMFALAEKEVSYRVQPRDEQPLLGGRVASNHRFGEPALDVGGYLVQGTETVLRFIGDAFDGPSLQPAEARERARMNRALELNYREAVTTLGSRIMDRYIAALVMDAWIDPTPSESILAAARKTTMEFEQVLGDDPFLAGADLSLADIALSSLLDGVMETPDHDLLVPANSKLGLWWQRVSAREAFKVTKPKGGSLLGFFYQCSPAEAAA